MCGCGNAVLLNRREHSTPIGREAAVLGHVLQGPDDRVQCAQALEGEAGVSLEGIIAKGQIRGDSGL